MTDSGESALVFGPIYYGTDGGSMSARLPVGKLETGGGEMEGRAGVTTRDSPAACLMWRGRIK